MFKEAKLNGLMLMEVYTPVVLFTLSEQALMYYNGLATSQEMTMS